MFHVGLTECEFSGSSVDYRIAKTLLDASTIFYNNIDKNNDKSENKEFLIKNLLSHSLLKNNNFWKSILVYEISLRYSEAKVDSDWCFQRVHQSIIKNLIHFG